jgi:hypothetical protein
MSAVADVIHEHDDKSNSLQFGRTLFVQIYPVCCDEAGASRYE